MSGEMRKFTQSIMAAASAIDLAIAQLEEEGEDLGADYLEDEITEADQLLWGLAEALGAEKTGYQPRPFARLHERE